MSGAPNVPVVTVKDGAALADSRDIAQAFGKEHRTVLRAIDNLVVQCPDLGQRNFVQTPYLDAQNGQTYRAFEMDRKGFSLLAMRFTGAKALQWQIAYVDEFDRMEKALAGGSAIVDGFGPAARSTLGGIMKRVTHSELQEAVGSILPAVAQPLIERLIEQSMLSHRYQLVEGVSALEVAEMIGFSRGKRPRGTSQFISRRLTRFHEERGIGIRRSHHGAGRVRLFDEVATRAWMRAGGKAETEQHVAERKGQQKLTFVLHEPRSAPQR